MPERQYSEWETVRAHLNVDMEWTSESQGERINRVACAGIATVIWAKGIPVPV